MAEKVAKFQSSRYLRIPLVIGFAAVITFGIVTFLFVGSKRVVSVTPVLLASPTNGEKRTPDIFSYKGEEGMDALTLLKQQASVGQDASGLVVSINNRKSDNSKHEYWSFFVNQKLAEAGPADYITKDSDQIVWKIERY